MIDYETDPRPLGELLKAWRPGMTRAQKAAELRASLPTFDGWCKGRGCGLEATVRRLMTVLDQSASVP